EQLPGVVQPGPGRPVAGRERLQGVGRDLHPAVEDGAAAVGQRVGEDVRGVLPAQSVVVQFQPGQDGGRGGERVEGAEEVADEVGVDAAVVAGGAARFRLFLQDLDAPSGVGQQV